MLKTIELTIVGEPKLHCSSCEQRVERILKAMPSVRQVRADADAQRIEVLFDSEVLAEQELASRLNAIGYTVETGSPTRDDASRGR